MRKGFAPVLLAVMVALVAIVVGEGVYVQNYIAQIDITRRSAMETAVIEALNIVEFSKKALKEAVQFSFYKATYEVTKMGDFCKYNDPKSCSEECKIPKSVPTLKCAPWWRIYEKTYEPSHPDLESYLENETSKYFQRYSGSVSYYGLKTTDYCPRPPGEVDVQDSGLGASVKLNNPDSMSYAGKFFSITEKNSNFSDSVDSTVFELYKIGKDNFIDKDGVGNAFSEADSGMPNKCADMFQGSCDMTNGKCGSTDCFGSDCCCQSMYFGDMCENQLPSCESKLSSKCSKPDETKAAACNFRQDDVITADEKYNCSVQQKISELANSASQPGLIDTDVEISNCIKVSHSSNYDYINMGDEGGKNNGCTCKVCKLDCSGPASCSGLSRSYCNRGCSWHGAKCSCSGLSREDCSSTPGCSWQSAHCGGTPDFECDRDFSATASSTYNDCNDMDASECVGHHCNTNIYCQGPPDPPEGGDYWDWLKTVKCEYNYFGTANTSVSITDVGNSYPSDGWTSLRLPFYVVSGNVDCSSGGGLCCPAVTTDDSQSWKYCKAAD